MLSTNAMTSLWCLMVQVANMREMTRTTNILKKAPCISLLQYDHGDHWSWLAPGGSSNIASLSLSLCSIAVSSVVCLNYQKNPSPKKQNMRSTQRHTKNHFQEPTQSHGPQAIFTYLFIDSKQKHPRAFISRVDLKLLNKVCRWDTPLLRTPCEVGGSGFVAAFVFQRNFSLPEIVFLENLAAEVNPNNYCTKKIMGGNEFPKHNS